MYFNLCDIYMYDDGIYRLTKSRVKYKSILDNLKLNMNFFICQVVVHVLHIIYYKRQIEISTTEIEFWMISLRFHLV